MIVTQVLPLKVGETKPIPVFYHWLPKFPYIGTAYIFHSRVEMSPWPNPKITGSYLIGATYRYHDLGHCVCTFCICFCICLVRPYLPLYIVCTVFGRPYPLVYIFWHHFWTSPPPCVHFCHVERPKKCTLCISVRGRLCTFCVWE